MNDANTAYRLGAQTDAVSDLSNVRIVLVNTYHAGNIGAAARAMKTMGVGQLVLVNPRDYPSEEATNRAAGALDVLDATRVVDTLEEAIQDCQCVIATSARRRGMDWPLKPFDEAMQCAHQQLAGNSNTQVAVVFGGERSGLNNEQLQNADFHAFIPANPEYPVLNLASAVQLACYELYKCQLGDDGAQERVAVDRPSSEDKQRLYEHMEQALLDIGFINQKHAGDVMVKLKRFFAKADIEQEELNIWRGIFSRIQS